VHFLRGEIDVGRAVVGDQEAVAVAMALQRALDFAEQARAFAPLRYCVLIVFDDRILVFPEMPRT